MSYQFTNNTSVLDANLHLIRPRECVHDALYLVGELPANYPMPALADTAMFCCLTAWDRDSWYKYAWDKIWRENIPSYIP